MMQVVGTLEMVKLEFYRRLITPYEWAKAIEEGDIPQYEQAEEYPWIAHAKELPDEEPSTGIIPIRPIDDFGDIDPD